MFFKNTFIILLFGYFIFLARNNPFDYIYWFWCGWMWLFSGFSISTFLLFWFAFYLFFLFFLFIIFLFFHLSLLWCIKTFKLIYDLGFCMISSPYFFIAKAFPTLIFTLRKRLWLPNTWIPFPKSNIAEGIQSTITVSPRHGFALIIIKWWKPTIMIMCRHVIDFVFLYRAFDLINFLKLLFHDCTIVIYFQFIKS